MTDVQKKSELGDDTHNNDVADNTPGPAGNMEPGDEIHPVVLQLAVELDLVTRRCLLRTFIHIVHIERNKEQEKALRKDAAKRRGKLAATGMPVQ
ncbi:unnamed protein product [Urochloa humidicola]